MNCKWGFLETQEQMRSKNTSLGFENKRRSMCVCVFADLTRGVMTEFQEKLRQQHEESMHRELEALLTTADKAEAEVGKTAAQFILQVCSLSCTVHQQKERYYINPEGKCYARIWCKKVANLESVTYIRQIFEHLQDSESFRSNS